MPHSPFLGRARWLVGNREILTFGCGASRQLMNVELSTRWRYTPHFSIAGAMTAGTDAARLPDLQCTSVSLGCQRHDRELFEPIRSQTRSQQEVTMPTQPTVSGELSTFFVQSAVKSVVQRGAES